MTHNLPELIVVGGGASGRKFMAAALAHGLTESYRIRALDERAAPQLTARGVVTEQERVLAVDPARHVLVTVSGRTFDYDALVLATGMRASIPDSVSAETPGCFVHRVPADLGPIRLAAAQRQRGVVVGGGRHGLQAAQVLRGLGLQTHVVESGSRLLPGWVDDTGSVVVHSRVMQLGVEVHLGAALQEVIAGDGQPSSVRLSDGNEIACDIVVVCPGARARDELGRASGLKLGDSDGIAIDERCQSSDPDVYAVGSVASFKGHCLNWPAAREMTAELAAAALAGEPATEHALEPHARFRVLGVDIATFGDAFGLGSDAAEVSVFDAVSNRYARLTVGEDGTRLDGGMLVGDVGRYAELLDYWTRGTALPTQPGYLIRLLSEPKARAAS